MCLGCQDFQCPPAPLGTFYVSGLPGFRCPMYLDCQDFPCQPIIKYFGNHHWFFHILSRFEQDHVFCRIIPAFLHLFISLIFFAGRFNLGPRFRHCVLGYSGGLRMDFGNILCHREGGGGGAGYFICSYVLRGAHVPLDRIVLLIAVLFDAYTRYDH